MQSTMSKPSPQKSERRVLGEKTANASLTPSTKRFEDPHSQKVRTTAIPFDVLSKKSIDQPIKQSPADACHAGQKRSIDQVEDSREIEAEPRKVLMTGSTEETRQFKIFTDDGLRVASRREEILETSNLRQTDGEKSQEETPREVSSRSEGEPPRGRIPTEPAARKVFLQQTAALARSRFQSAMRQAENTSLDRALSLYEANSRPFLRSLVPASPTANAHQQSRESKIQRHTSTPQKRVLLPPLPLQPRSRPVRSSAQTTAPSQSSATVDVNDDLPDTEDEAEVSGCSKSDEGDRTPRQSDVGRQADSAVESHDERPIMSQESDSVMDKLIKWTQSSNESLSME